MAEGRASSANDGGRSEPARTLSQQALGQREPSRAGAAIDVDRVHISPHLSRRRAAHHHLSPALGWLQGATPLLAVNAAIASARRLSLLPATGYSQRRAECSAVSPQQSALNPEHGHGHGETSAPVGGNRSPLALAADMRADRKAWGKHSMESLPRMPSQTPRPRNPELLGVCRT
ncbi:hypothetical protein P154DRAFT_618718 [Amniculicola lignicola CBS 123094]|uniref:Uncharacterized protein n=1 Tax=Amniculicola lignicola CBS 123094 TaxID=1392246 RepID=A0A6A5WXE1_9PLEO|nr:hypothetical protein P154DRAFT_618718 [Amniculicola lignicola CBS 123094]